MMDRISSRDVEDVSAYLDGHLPAQEKQRLEGRLRVEPEMRALYEQLQQTRRLLRSQPPLRAPRNFTLTPEMAGRRAKASLFDWLAPGLRLVSAVATVLLFVVLMGDYLAAPAALAPVQDQAVRLEQEGVPLLQTSPVVGAGTPEAIAKAFPQPAPALPAAPTEAEAPAAAAVPQAFEAAPPPPAAPVQALPAAGVNAAGQSPDQPAETMAPPQEAESLAMSSAPSEAGSAAPASGPGESGAMKIRVAEIILVTLALGAGLASIFVSRHKG
jgi:hypothetical protein